MIKVLLEIYYNISREPLVSIQKSAMKEMAGDRHIFG